MNYIDGRLILNENVIELIKREFGNQKKQIEERYAEFKAMNISLSMYHWNKTIFCLINNKTNKVIAQFRMYGYDDNNVDAVLYGKVSFPIYLMKAFTRDEIIDYFTSEGDSEHLICLGDFTWINLNKQNYAPLFTSNYLFEAYYKKTIIMYIEQGIEKGDIVYNEIEESNLNDVFLIIEKNQLDITRQLRFLYLAYTELKFINNILLKNTSKNSKSNIMFSFVQNLFSKTINKSYYKKIN